MKSRILVLMVVGLAYVSSNDNPAKAQSEFVTAGQIQKATQALEMIRVMYPTEAEYYSYFLELANYLQELACSAEAATSVKNMATLYRNARSTDDPTQSAKFRLGIAQNAFDLLPLAIKAGWSGSSALYGIQMSGLAVSSAMTPVYSALFVTDVQLRLADGILSLVRCSEYCLRVRQMYQWKIMRGQVPIPEQKIINDLFTQFSECVEWEAWSNGCLPVFPDAESQPGEVESWPPGNPRIRYICDLAHEKPSSGADITSFIARAYYYNMGPGPASFSIKLRLLDDNDQDMILTEDGNFISHNESNLPETYFKKWEFRFSIPKADVARFANSGRIVMLFDDTQVKEIDLRVPRISIEPPTLVIDAITGVQVRRGVVIDETGQEAGLGNLRVIAFRIIDGSVPPTDVAPFVKASSLRINAGGTGTLAVSVSVPEDFPAGSYSGELLVEGTAGGGVYFVPITVNVIPDDIIPSQVTDLTALAGAQGEVRLYWTAPGSNGSSGKAAFYIIRYSETPIDDLNWDSAADVDGEPTPQVCGSGEGFRIGGLNPDVIYHFALKSADISGNSSLLSNMASTGAGTHNAFPVHITGPTGADEAQDHYVIWFDPVDLSICRLKLYYDVDKDPSQKNLLVTYNHQSAVIDNHYWDTHTVPSGNYYIYADMEQGGQHYTGYSQEKVTVVHNDYNNYEPNNTIYTAYGPIRAYDGGSNTIYYSYVQSSGDQDWFKFQSTAQTISARLSSLPSGCNYKMALWRGGTGSGDYDDPDDAFQVQVSWSDGNGNQVVSYQGATAWYWIRVYSTSGYTPSDPYELRVWFNPDNQPPSVYRLSYAGLCDDACACPNPFRISWYASDEYSSNSGVAWVDIQYQDIRDGAWRTWKDHVKGDPFRLQGQDTLFLEDNHRYDFRIRAMDKMGNVSAWKIADWGPVAGDLSPPVSSVSPLDSVQNQSEFVTNWSGFDQTCGISSYLIQYMKNNSGVWVNWIETSDTSAVFSREVDPAMSQGDLYAFRSVAKDKVNLWETDTTSEGDSRTRIGVDVTPPATISDLQVFPSNQDGELILKWTASGDDGLEGRASFYSVRFSDQSVLSVGRRRDSNVPILAPATETAWLDHSSWDTLDVVPDAKSPDSCALPESIIVQGLTPGLFYFFGLFSADEMMNQSNPSNVVSGIAGADSFPPSIVSGPFTSGIDNDLADIMWYTDEKTDARIEYWAEGDSGHLIADSALNTVHCFILSGLDPTKTYHVAVSSYDSKRNGPAQAELEISAPVSGCSLSVASDTVTVFAGDSAVLTLRVYEVGECLEWVELFLDDPPQNVVFDFSADSLLAGDSCLLTFHPHDTCSDVTHNLVLRVTCCGETHLDTFTLRIGGTAVPSDESLQGNIGPLSFALLQNYPNPFNPECQIIYALPRDADVSLFVYNVLGQKVRTLVDEYQAAGHRAVHWDGTDEDGNRVASGIYFYRIEAGEFKETRKMILMK